MATLISIALLNLSACGGGGSDLSSPPPAAVDKSVGGIWRAQTTSPSGATVAGLIIITEDGRYSGSAENPANDCAEVSQGTLTVSGSNFQGSGDFGLIKYTTVPDIQVDCTFADGSVWGAATLSGSVVQRSALTLTAEGTTSMGTVLAGTTGAWTFDTLYNESSSLAKLAGNWTSQTGTVITIDADGVIFSQDATTGCVVNGQVSIINAMYDAYAVTATYASCETSIASLNGVTATGLIALNDQVSPNQIYMGYSLTLPSGDVLIITTDATR
jgi:hypothetical protein